MTSAKAIDLLSSVARNRRDIMEESIIKKYLDSLNNAQDGFLHELSVEDQFELGTFVQSYNERIDFNGLEWTVGTDELTDLNRLFGAETTDYGWSVVDTWSHNVTESLPILMGIMSSLGFEWVGLQEGCWYDADQELSVSMDEEERQHKLAETFWLKIRFYPNKPGEDKCPKYICPNTSEFVESVLYTARETADVIDGRNRLWWCSYESTPPIKKYDVLSKLEKRRPRIARNGINVIMEMTKDPDEFLSESRELHIYKESVLLLKYGKDVMAFGPDAILMA